jgi:hypothetical protein
MKTTVEKWAELTNLVPREDATARAILVLAETFREGQEALLPLTEFIRGVAIGLGGPPLDLGVEIGKHLAEELKLKRCSHQYVLEGDNCSNCGERIVNRI